MESAISPTEGETPGIVKSRTLLFLWIVAIASIIVTFFVIRYKIKPGNSAMALHYTILSGVDVYGRGTTIYQIPIIGLVVVLVNFALYRSLRRSRDFLAFLAALVSVAVGLALLLAVIFLLRVT